MTRSVWRKIHPIPASLKAEDGWMILCVKAFARCYHFPLVTYFYRIHPGNSVPFKRDFLSYRQYLLDRIDVYAEFLSKYGACITSSLNSEILSLSKLRFFAGNHQFMRILFVKAPASLKFKSMAICNKYLFLILKLLVLFRVATL